MVSVLAIVFGSGGLIRGWQMGFKGRLDLISDFDNRALPNPAAYAPAYARIYLGIGSVLLAMPLLLLLGMHLIIWCTIGVVVMWYWFHAIEVVAQRARSKNQ